MILGWMPLDERRVRLPMPRGMESGGCIVRCAAEEYGLSISPTQFANGQGGAATAEHDSFETPLTPRLKKYSLGS